jgi:hypothetical protein
MADERGAIGSASNAFVLVKAVRLESAAGCNCEARRKIKRSPARPPRKSRTPAVPQTAKFRSAPVTDPKDCLMPGSVSTAAAGHRLQPLQSCR